MIIEASLQLRRRAEANRDIRRRLRQINRRRHETDDLVLRLSAFLQTHIFWRQKMLPAVLSQILGGGAADLPVSTGTLFPPRRGVSPTRVRRCADSPRADSETPGDSVRDPLPPAPSSSFPRFPRFPLWDGSFARVLKCEAALHEWKLEKPGKPGNPWNPRTERALRRSASADPFPRECRARRRGI